MSNGKRDGRHDSEIDSNNDSLCKTKTCSLQSPSLGLETNSEINSVCDNSPHLPSETAHVLVSPYGRPCHPIVAGSPQNVVDKLDCAAREVSHVAGQQGMRASLRKGKTETIHRRGHCQQVCAVQSNGGRGGYWGLRF